MQVFPQSHAGDEEDGPEAAAAGEAARAWPPTHEPSTLGRRVGVADIPLVKKY